MIEFLIEQLAQQFGIAHRNGIGRFNVIAFSGRHVFTIDP